MIVSPENWKRGIPYRRPPINIVGAKRHAEELIDILVEVLCDVDIAHLSLSGGIDSTLLLALQNKVTHTYTISCREDHPDVLFARIAAKAFNANHLEIIVEPEALQEDEELGDNAVRQFYNTIENYTTDIIAGDGIDELACGYYDHLNHPNREEAYLGFIHHLTGIHLVPLNRNSGQIRVTLPYLDQRVVSYLQGVSLIDKLENNTRKAIIVEAAKILKVPDVIIQRNKYGFCDAFRDEDK